MKTYRNKIIISIVISMLLVTSIYADDKEDKLQLLKLRNTNLNLIKELVGQGVLTRKQALGLIKKSESSANEEMEKLTQEQIIEPDTVRIPLVPEIIKQSIREQVRTDLREDVARDVLAKAKQERWGVPGVLPNWVERIKLSGDIRVRAQYDFFDSDNTNPTIDGDGYFDYQAINDKGGITAAAEQAFLNNYENRERLRVRARLGIKAKVTQGWQAGLRIATGSFSDPVSTNQTLGNSNRNFRLVLERAYIQYTSEIEDFKWYGGRVPNPWLSTDLVWDKDLSFDGLVFNFHLNKSENALDQDDNIDTDPFFTLGAFPLSEENRYADKWLLGVQAGVHHNFINQSKLSIALAYYDYQGIAAKRNTFGSTLNTHTAPDYVQKGNSMFNINETGGERYGLATDYNLLNLTFKYDFANFSPVHVYLTADYVKNTGYKITEDAKAADPLTVGASGYKEESDGYQLRLDIGWPDYKVRDNWRLYFAYKKLGRDAVLDAFTDSDFHLGGTDAEGFIVGFNYGLDDNVWLSSRWISSDVINGIQFGPGGRYKVDTVQMEINSKF